MLPRRVPDFRPDMLDRALLRAASSCGSAPRADASQLAYRDDAALLGPPPGAAQPPAGETQAHLRAALAGGPRFLAELAAETGLAGAELVEPRSGDLAWSGEVTNDAWAPLRTRAAQPSAARPATRPGTRRLARRRVAPTGAALGRWSSTQGLFASAPAGEERIRALAELLLERHGVLTRAAVAADGVPGGFSALYRALRDLETLGACRRGYFIEGLGGAQFALAGAVERLRDLREAPEAGGFVVLASTDPANPYGASLPWPARAGGRAQRVPGAYVVLRSGEPVLAVERSGRGLIALAEPDASWLGPAIEAVAEQVRRGRPRRLALERFDGEPVLGSPAEDALRTAGFLAGPRRMVLAAAR